MSVSMIGDEAPTSDEARKMCERAEYYMEKIRSQELRFTQAANAIKFYHHRVKRDLPLPEYARLEMNDYDDAKVDQAEFRLRANSHKLEDVPYREHNEDMLKTVSSTRFLIARNFLRAIDVGLTNPERLIQEGEAFFSKLEQCNNEKKAVEAERDRFKSQLEEVSTELISLQALYEACQRQLHINPH